MRARTVIVALAFMAGLLAGAVLAPESVPGPSKEPPRREEPDAEESLFLVGTPLIEGDVIPLANAEGRTPFRLRLPDDPLASEELIYRVWITPKGSNVAIVYSTGVVVYEEREWVGRRKCPKLPEGQQYGEEYGEESCDMPTTFDELARRAAKQDAEYFNTPVADWLATVKGRTAYVVRPRPGLPGSVLFSYEGVRITVRGLFELDTLLLVAESFE
jgi:hypothetical protein